jgi:hypothetical protein
MLNRFVNCSDNRPTTGNWEFEELKEINKISKNHTGVPAFLIDTQAEMGSPVSV